MFTSNSITLENSEKIIVVGKESGLAFFGALFALVFWLCIAIYNLNLITIIVSSVIGLFTLFLFYQPKKIISELDLNQRKVFIHLDVIMKWFSHGVGVSSVVAAIFGGNADLCELVPAGNPSRPGQWC